MAPAVIPIIVPVLMLPSITGVCVHWADVDVDSGTVDMDIVDVDVVSNDPVKDEEV